MSSAPSDDNASSTGRFEPTPSTPTHGSTVYVQPGRKAGTTPALEANIILIAHPEDQRLGTRYRLTPGAALDIGRSPELTVSLPEVPAISRHHARLHHRGMEVVIEDLGSTNGTHVNGERIDHTAVLHSGDRFQVASVHFKFLHEKDVEHAYYEAIYNLVTHDGLTDIFNKRKYDEEVEREFARARRHQRPLSLVLLDLDHFKEVNDRHGHLCGDFVLKKFTSVVRELLRPEQTFARVGGDEFVVLSPEMQAADARQLAEKVCRRVAATEILCAGVALRVTCSCGIAELTAEMKQPEDLYSATDRALYRSKLGGRNRASVIVEDA